MGYRDYSTVIGRIVDPNGKGDFTTIQSAIDAASADETIYIRPGTYTENLTLKAGIILVASELGNSVGVVTLVGKISASYSGSTAIKNITVSTNGDFAIEVSGANATALTIERCSLTGVANTIISNTCSNSGSILSLTDCSLDVLTTGITAFVLTGAGDNQFNGCGFANTGGTTTRSTISSGGLGLNGGVSLIPFTWSGSSSGGGNIRIQAPIGTTEVIAENSFVDFTGSFFGGFGQNVPVLTVTSPATVRIAQFSTYSTSSPIDGTGEIIVGRIQHYNNGTITVATVSPMNLFPVASGGSGFTLGTPQATTSGTSFNFGSIPSGTTQIVIMFKEVSTTTNEILRVQIGDAGGIETTGYISQQESSSQTTSTTGFLVTRIVGSVGYSGQLTLTLFDASTFSWSGVATSLNTSGTPSAGWGSGDKSLSAELTQLTISGEGGVSFDAGSVNIAYI